MSEAATYTENSKLCHESIQNGQGCETAALQNTGRNSNVKIVSQTFRYFPFSYVIQLLLWNIPTFFQIVTK